MAKIQIKSEKLTPFGGIFMVKGSLGTGDSASTDMPLAFPAKSERLSRAL